MSLKFIKGFEKYKMISFSLLALDRNLLATDLAQPASFPFFRTSPLAVHPSLFKRGLLRASWPTGAIQPRTPRRRVCYELKIHRGGLSPLWNLVSNLHEFESGLIWDCTESTLVTRRSNPPINRSPPRAVRQQNRADAKPLRSLPSSTARSRSITGVL
jgi:hypothetical protein